MVTDKMADIACVLFLRGEYDSTAADGRDARDQMRFAIEQALAAAWVPCAERMPEDGVEVLVAVWPSVYIAEREDGEWWAIDRMPSAIGGVTHWMPLPEPPQKAGRVAPAGKITRRVELATVQGRTGLDAGPASPSG